MSKEAKIQNVDHFSFVTSNNFVTYRTDILLKELYFSDYLLLVSHYNTYSKTITIPKYKIIYLFTYYFKRGKTFLERSPFHRKLY